MKKLSSLCIAYIVFMILIPRIAIERISDVFQMNYDYLNDTYNVLTVIILSFISMYFYKNELKNDWISLKKVHWILSGFIGLFFVIFIGVVLALVVLGGQAEQSSNQSNLESIATPIVANILPIVVVLLGPILEEILFKGFLIKTLSQKFNSYLLAMISILLFSLMHMSSFTEIKAILPYVSISLVTTLYFFRKKYNIWYPIIIHVFNNLIAQIIMLAK